MAHFPEFQRLGCQRTDFEGVIFDFDGTLADSMHVWTEVDELFCQRYNLGVPSDFRDSIVGLGFEGTAEYFINVLGVPLTVQECIDEFNRLAYDCYRDEVRLKPGVREYLDSLDQRGIPYCIASSLCRDLLEVSLKANGIQGRFANLSLCDEHNTHKSEGLIYRIAAEGMGCDVSNCAIFEDILPAINTANRLGAFSVAIIDEGNEAQDTPQVQRLAALSIDSYSQLLS